MVLKQKHLLIVAVWASLTLSGCFLFVTKREGDKLRSDVARLKKRLNQLRSREKELVSSLEKAKTDQKKLEKVLDRAHKILMRDSADLGAKVSELQVQAGKILGRLENLEKDLKDASNVKKELVQMIHVVRMDVAGLKQRLAALMVRPKEPQGADTVFAHAQKLFTSGAYAQARKYFNMFTSSFPTDSRVEHALYSLAESYYKENKFAAADYSFRTLLGRFPSGTYASRAWFSRARCHFELKYCKSAQRLLAQLLRLFPKSPQAVQARRMSQQIRRVLHNPRYCGS